MKVNTMYYLVEITTYNDGHADEVGLYKHETLDSAKATFHTKMGGMMKKSTVETELLTIINGDGLQYATEKYEKAKEGV